MAGGQGDALQQALRAIEARDRIIAQQMAKRPGRGAAAPADQRQAEMPLSRWPLTEFAMGPGLHIPLPATLADIAEEIGRELAVRLSEALRPVDEFGQMTATGSRPWRRMIYVPRRMKPDHPLVGILGWPAANRLQRSHTNMVLEIPYCADLYRAYRARVIGQMADAGYDINAIAAWVQIHPRSVQSALDGRETTPEEPGQNGRDDAGGKA